MDDLYRLFRLTPGASEEEIKKAYRKFAFHFHPDRNREKGYLFLVVQRAYHRLLEDARKREAEAAAPPAESGPAENGEPVDHNAHHDLSFVRQKIEKKPKKKNNIYMFRVPKVVSPKKMCPTCRGYGVVENRFSLASNCPACNGTGSRYRTEL